MVGGFDGWKVGGFDGGVKLSNYQTIPSVILPLE
jgi:hypothetical protein